MGKSAPKYPDPKATAGTQYQYNLQGAKDTSRLNAQSANRFGPFGSTTTQVDANGLPTGQTASLSSTLQGAADTGQNVAAAQFGLLPTSGINWDQTTAPYIANQNYNAYAAMTAPQRQQQQTQLETQLSDRGIPIGSEIWNNANTNLNNSFNLADTNAAAQAWNAVPGMQGQLTNNQIAQYNQPFSAASNTLGLLSGIGGLTPGFAALPNVSVNAPDYTSQVANKYNADAANYQNQMSGLGSLVGTGLGLLATPITGPTGLSNTLLGRGLGLA